MKKAIAIFVICCVVAAFADNPHITRLIELVDTAISSPADGDVLTFSSSTGKWSNKQPATSDGPRLILRYQQENVSGTIVPVTLFTPDETAMYQWNLVFTSPISNTCSGAGDFGGVVLNSGDGVFLAGTGNALGVGRGAREAVPFIGVAGSPWILTSVSNLSTDDCPYSFYIVVEKL